MSSLSRIGPFTPYPTLLSVLIPNSPHAPTSTFTQHFTPIASTLLYFPQFFDLHTSGSFGPFGLVGEFCRGCNANGKAVVEAAMAARRRTKVRMGYSGIEAPKRCWICLGWLL
jgi:hypothetical protein